MGGCFSVGRRVDLTGNTFSHYSLSSQSEHIDLYPGFRSGSIFLAQSQEFCLYFKVLFLHL